MVNNKRARKSGQKNGWEAIKSLDDKKEIRKLFLGERAMHSKGRERLVIISDREGTKSLQTRSRIRDSWTSQ